MGGGRAGEGRPRLVFDAGPVVYLDTLGYMPALEDLFLVAIPTAVARELSRRPGTPGSGAPTRDLVEVLTPDDEYTRRVASGEPAVDAGEREVISLSISGGFTAVIDDRLGRMRARRLGASLTGTVGVLEAVHLSGRGLLPYAEDLDALTGAGMYLSEEVKRLALSRFQAALETSP